MDVQNVANAVVHMASLPLDANILFLTVMATKMPFAGWGLADPADQRVEAGADRAWALTGLIGRR